MRGSWRLGAAWSVLVVGCGDRIDEVFFQQELIAFSTAHEGVSLITPDGSDERTVAEDGGGPYWAPDGERLMYFGSAPEGPPFPLFLLETTSQESTKLAEFDGLLGIPISWHPDSSRFAIHAGLGEIFIVDAVNAHEPRALYGPADGLSAPSWTPDGQTVVVRTDEGIVGIDVETGEASVILAVETWGPPFVAPSGDRIAFATYGDGFEVEVVGLDGTGRTVVGGDPDGDARGWLRWAPDGSHLVFFTGDDEAVRVWATSVPEGEQRLLDEQPPGKVWGGDFSPDGASVVYTHDFDLDTYSGPDSVIELLDIESGTSEYLADGDSVSWRPRVP